MLLTHGGRFSGWGLYLLKGKPVFCYNLAGVARYYVTGKDKVAPGAHTIVYDFKYDSPGLGKGGVGTIQVDGKTVATGRIERTLAFRLSLDKIEALKRGYVAAQRAEIEKIRRQKRRRSRRAKNRMLADKSHHADKKASRRPVGME